MNIKSLAWHFLRRPGVRSYSQVGEDLIVRHIFGEILGIAKVRYLDIGANHPVSLSNTYRLYEDGGRGVCIDPAPDLARKYAVLRPGDLFLPYGIKFSEADEADLYLMNPVTFSTFSREQADEMIRTGQVQLQEVVKVHLVDVNDVLAEHFSGGIDFLNIDVEGCDLEIVSAIDFARFRPKIICVETSHEARCKGEESPTLICLAKHGYAVMAKTCYNDIVIDNASRMIRQENPS